jgi:hypothetical protein
MRLIRDEMYYRKNMAIEVAKLNDTVTEQEWLDQLLRLNDRDQLLVESHKFTHNCIVHFVDTDRYLKPFIRDNNTLGFREILSTPKHFSGISFGSAYLILLNSPYDSFDVIYY